MTKSITTMSSKKRSIVTMILLISTFLSLMSQTMMITALPVIQKEMGVALTLAQWLTTGYTLVIGVVTPLSANLYHKFSNRKVFLGIIAVFILGTVMGCITFNFWTLLLARLIQACAGGLLMSFQMTTMVSIYPPEKRGSILGLSGLVVAFGPAIGPTLSGIIVSFLGWRYLFYLVLPIMVVIWLVSYFYFPNYSQPQDIKIDYLSVIMSLVGLGLTLASMTIMQMNILYGLISLVIGLIIIYFFVKRQLILKTPMLKVDIFKSRPFRLMTIVGVFAFMVLLGTEQMLSVFAQNSLHLSSYVAGMIMLPGAVFNALTAVIVGRAYDRFGPKWLISSGAILMLIGSIPFVTVSAHSSVTGLVVGYIFRMIGNALVFSPAMSESFIEVDVSEISHATALNNAIRQTFGAVSITVLVVISSIPQSAILGMNISMWCTVVMIVAILIFFGYYLKVKEK